MPASTRSQNAMLRYWAMNMAAVGFNWIGFSYTPDETKRLQAIASGVSGGAYGVWIVIGAAIYCGVAVAAAFLFLGPLVVAPGVAPVGVFLSALAAMAIFTMTFGLPLAMSVGGRIADALFHMPPQPEADGDAALYGKIRQQIGWFAIAGVTLVGVLMLLSYVFGIDVTQYAGALQWLYYAALFLQALMALRYIRTRPAGA